VEFRKGNLVDMRRKKGKRIRSKRDSLMAISINTNNYFMST